MKKIIFIISLVAIIILTSTAIPAEGQEKPLPDQIFLHTGSPLILSEDKIAPLDPENLDVAATVINSRTLLPLRAIGEYFGAEVSYDAQGKTAIILHGDAKYLFPINEKKYIIVKGDSQREVAMDTSSMIMNNRTMVPMRVISEEILGLTVDYKDRVIAISKDEVNLGRSPQLVKAVKEKIGVAVKAGSINELEKIFTNKEGGLYPVGGRVEGTVNQNEVATDNAAGPTSGGAAPSDGVVAQESATSKGSGGEQDYSTTNTQVEGIDEADIVKTDGKYIYWAGNNALRIIHTDNGMMDDTATIKLPKNKYVQEIYVDGDRLVMLGNRNEEVNYPGGEVRPMTGGPEPAVDMDIAAIDRIMPPYYPVKSFAFVDVYDISNPERPTFVKGHEMEGSYQSSRKNGEIVYLITNTYMQGNIYLPLMRDTVIGSEMQSISIDDIMILPDFRAQGYVIVSALDIRNDEKTQVEAIAQSGYTTYMNDSTLYLAAYEYNDSTSIIKFQIKDTNIGYAGSGKVEGQVLNQFSMDEWEGYLRVATTTWDKGNGIYVLDDSLNIYGSVEGLAKDERIYSVRFMGDKGYIVTFRNIDPLFVFDLSDPSAPKVTGELKIPGFSNYLHPVGEDLLLGIGAETYEIYQKDDKGNEIVIGNRQGGIKFSLFDVSDMGKPREVAKSVIGGSGSYTEAFYNHKAIMFDGNEDVVAIDAWINEDQKGMEHRQGAILMNYGERNLKLKGILDGSKTSVYGPEIPKVKIKIKIMMMGILIGMKLDK